MSDPWSQFAAVAPTAAVPRHLAYVDADSVGFDVRMALPARCLTCGATERLGRKHHRLKVKADVAAFLANQLRGDRLDGAVQFGDRIELVLPFCLSCQAMQRKAIFWSRVAKFSPVWGIALVVAFAAISSSLIGLAFLLFLGGALFAGLGGRWLASSHIIELERLDGDGIMRMRPVHPDAAQAILEAAGMSS